MTSEIPSPIDLIDCGAGDDEPVKGVTHGHLRQWHDSIEGMDYLLKMLTDELQQRDQDEEAKPCISCGEKTEHWWSYCAMCGWHIAAGNSPKCNHWPGQTRCGVCGMGYGYEERRT